MCPTARRAELDFTRLVSQSGSSLYLERLLAGGFSALSSTQQRCFPGLNVWRGMNGLSEDIAKAFDQPIELPIYYLSRSRSLIELAAEVLFADSSHVLVTDLIWPSYSELLRQLAREHSATIHCCKLRPHLERGATQDELLRFLINAYSEANCTAAFLSHISYEGICLPVAQFRNSMHKNGSLVVDGAQAVGQLPLSTRGLDCDLYLSSAQKWLGGFHPFRMAIVGSPRAARQANAAASRSQDAMLHFCQSLRAADFPPHGETVSVLPLITAAAAIYEYRSHGKKRAGRRWAVRCSNSQRLLQHVELDRWSSFAVKDVHTGIIVLRPVAGRVVTESLRTDLAEQGIIATTYADGSIRMAMPSFDLSLRQLEMVDRALSSVQISPPSKNRRQQENEIHQHRRRLARTSQVSRRQRVTNDHESCY